MHFIAIEIRLGQAGRGRMEPRRQMFHEDVARLIAGVGVGVHRLGDGKTIGFDYEQLAYQASNIRETVVGHVGEICATAFDVPKLILIDITTGAFNEVRESILIYLALAVEDLFQKYVGVTTVLLIPRLPGSKQASMVHFAGMETLAVPVRLGLVTDSGDARTVCNGTVPLEFDRMEYARLRRSLEEEPRARLARKRVRRLGRFRRSTAGLPSRFFSDLLLDCAPECISLLEEFWKDVAPNTKVLLYDTKNVPALKDATLAFGGAHGLKSYRIREVLEASRPPRAVTSDPGCVLVLDAVETGATLQRYQRDLRNAGVQVNKNVVTAINRMGSGIVDFDGMRVHSFLASSPDPREMVELQDSLRLRYTPEDIAPHQRMRAIDFYYMAGIGGWKGETEIPDKVGQGYSRVPNIQRLLEEFGDWLGFLMDDLLSQAGCPSNMFLIHPDEPGANAVSARLRVRRGENMTVVRVPRKPDIELAQAHKNDWVSALAEIPSDREWRDQLESVGSAVAVITDEFNGSGSTYATLQSLLDHYKVRTMCYFPLFDRDCGPDVPLSKYKCQRMCLYEWFGPRRLHGAA